MKPTNAFHERNQGDMQIEYRAGFRSEGLLPQLKQAMQGQKTEVIALRSSELKHQKVSAVIITYNEEAIIAETLSRLWWCDEIIIVDSFSTDRTVDICQEFGCAISQKEFRGFGPQKQAGVALAKNDWVLCLDADEVLNENLIDEIRQLLSEPQIAARAFTMRRTLVFMNRVFKHGKESGAPIVRLFDKRFANWDDAIVHEKVIVNGKTGHMENRILHFSYNDYGQFLSKINLYSSLGADKMLVSGKKKSRFLVIAAMPFNLFKYYILDRNFLNGYPGFTWSVLNTVYHFVKYLKLEALQSGTPSGSEKTASPKV